MSRASALSQLLDKNLCFCKLENIVDQHTLFRAVNYKHISRFSSFYLHQDHFCCYNQRHLKFNPQKILDGWYKCSTFPINYSEFKCVSNCHYGYNQKPSFSDCQAWKKKFLYNLSKDWKTFWQLQTTFTNCGSLTGCAGCALLNYHAIEISSS